MAFETVSEATRLWIKGREFSVKRLLGETYAHEAPKYDGGALGIFRLAPQVRYSAWKMNAEEFKVVHIIQDYHRFHSPVDGVVGPMTYIPGEYYTVNVGVTSVLFITMIKLVSCSPKRFVPNLMCTVTTSERLSLLIRQCLDE
jgi:phosphatidylserine decarboxylase